MLVISQLNDHPNTKEHENKIFGKALMLGVAYMVASWAIEKGEA